MVLMLILTLAGAVALWVLRERLLETGGVSAPVAPPRAARQPGPRAVVSSPYTATARTKLDELVMLEWDDVTGTQALAIAAAAPVGAIADAAPASDPLRRKLRDRYMQARFPGVVASSADLEDGTKVVKGVRLYFEEGKLDRADELLEVAVDQAPGSKTLRLAQLELAFLRRAVPAFIAFARDFSRDYPLAPEWNEICRLGTVIAPTETTLFGAPKAEHHHGRYGPWPDLPNWLHASWDLTAEILAADLHRAMASAEVPVRAEVQRSAR